MKPPTLATSALVTFITLVIWALAETQTLLTDRVTAVVSFAADSPEMLVRVVPGETWSGAVQVELSGPAATINRVREDLARGVTLRVNRELGFVEGSQSVDLGGALARHETIAGTGVAVVRSIPDRVRLEMARAVTVTRPVVFAAAGAQLRGEPTIEPDEVEVRVAEPEAGSLPELVTASPAPRRIEQLVPGERTTLGDVQLSLGRADRPWGLEIIPSRVSVTLELRSATDSIVFPAIPVGVLMPADLVGEWEVVIDEADRFLRDVRVSGPASAINRWRQRGDEPVAYIRLRQSDVESGSGEARAELIELSPSFTVSIDDNRIAYTVRRRRDEPTEPTEPTESADPPNEEPAEQSAEQPSEEPAERLDAPADAADGDGQDPAPTEEPKPEQAQPEEPQPEQAQPEQAQPEQARDDLSPPPEADNESRDDSEGSDPDDGDGVTG